MRQPVVDLHWASATKLEIVVEIARCIGAEPPSMSTGSTEPRRIFELVNERLGLGIDRRLGKADMAHAIVEGVGFEWHPDFESRGATVTKPGLLAVLGTVQFLLR